MTSRLSQSLTLFMAKTFLLLFNLNLFILNILLFFGQNFSSAETVLALHCCIAQCPFIDLSRVASSLIVLKLTSQAVLV